jgi:hypothetical protein
LDTVQDFEDLLELLERFEVRYLIIGGLAFIFHDDPRHREDARVLRMVRERRGQNE